MKEATEKKLKVEVVSHEQAEVESEKKTSGESNSQRSS